MRSMVWLMTGSALGLTACDEGTPPGAEGRAAPASLTITARDGGAVPGVAKEPEEPSYGTLADNLPFAPTGETLTSVAWRTWVYTDTGPKRTRYGYLRAGAVVDRRGPVIVNEGCAGGWWRINPRGYVCVGKGATLDSESTVGLLAAARPKRGEGLPYGYALALERAPHLYFKFPTADEMKRVEGNRWVQETANIKVGLEAMDTNSRPYEPLEPPEPLTTLAVLEKPYGVKKRLHQSVHTGQASSASGFAFHEVYDWQGRLMALTTEHDLIALDRTRVVRPSKFRGVILEGEEDLPAAFVTRRWALRYERAETGQLVPKGSFEYRQGLNLTGERLRYEGVTFWETSEQSWVPQSSITLLEPRSSFPSVATGTRKWIDVSIRQQTLVAYEGRKAVYATLVSTGRGGLGDPDKVPATVRGTFMIHTKHVTSTMDGEDDVTDSFELRDVPFVQYFHRGYALHGTYWHDDFGKIRSHGCVNLSPIDAAWMFEWTDPEVFPDWHGALNQERGTVVLVRP
jgi:lipoprotein-anchoring transpeptidase ErfK/SrfK